MRKVGAILLAAALAVVVGAGCSDSESAARSMEQIYAEEGVPVKVHEVTAEPFSVTLEYNATLTGIEESSEYAMIDDRVEAITVSVGDLVQKDSVLVTFPTDNPSARYYQAKTAYENARATYARMSGYYETGGLSLQEYQDCRAQFRVAEADWEAASQSVNVKAPISGVVTKLNVRKSDNVKKEAELLTVSRTDSMKCHIWVAEKQISQLHSGQTATATWNGTVLAGSIDQVDMSVNSARQAFGVIIKFANPELIVQCGVTARVQVATYVADKTVFTERKNVFTKQGKSFVYVEEDGFAQKRFVTLGRTSGLDVQILQGLNSGDRLIVEGQLQLEDGRKVRNIEEAPSETTVAQLTPEDRQ